MHRDRCPSANSSTVLDTSQGPVFMRLAADAGMVAVDGVVRPQRPTSMTRRNCGTCDSAAPCACADRPMPTLHGNHDRIFTAADLVLQASTCTKRACTFYVLDSTRMCSQGGNWFWAPGVDHSVVSARLWVGPGQTQNAAGVEAIAAAIVVKQSRRFRLLPNLKLRAVVKRTMAETYDRQCRDGLGLGVNERAKLAIDAARSGPSDVRGTVARLSRQGG